MDIKNNEKQFFDEVYVSGCYDTMEKISYAISKSCLEYYKNFIFSNCDNKKILEYGCGKGSYAFSLAKQGANVVGIDISEVAIQLANARSKEQGVEIPFLVMDGERMDFEDDRFDLVCGTAILHHLQLNKALKEIARVLKPNGKAIFLEPMAYNPAINIFRKLMPHWRTKDEHPFRNKDLRLFKDFFHQANYEFFNLFSLFFAPFICLFPNNTDWFSLPLKVAEHLDRKLFQWVPPLKLLAWEVVIIVEEPKKTEDR